MKWITRQGIQVNRTATCWLIRRFLDSEAEFLFVPTEEVATAQAAQCAIGFDAPGATYPHKNTKGLCSFAALVYERLADDPVLVEMAQIIQGADFEDQLGSHPAARGLALISRGFPMVTQDDYETAQFASFLYDAANGKLTVCVTNHSEIACSEGDVASPSRLLWQVRHNVAGGSAARRALSMGLPHSAHASFFLNTSRALFNNLAAQTNSVARMASPSGITMNAGPGNTIMAIPMSNTEKPTTAMIARLSHLRLGIQVIFCHDAS